MHESPQEVPPQAFVHQSGIPRPGDSNQAERQRLHAIERMFIAEREDAQRGEWDVSKSYFFAAFAQEGLGGMLVSSRNTVTGRESKCLEELRIMNTKVLDDRVASEQLMIDRGEWIPEISHFFISHYNERGASHLSREKHERLLTLVNYKHDQEEIEILGSFLSSFVAEKRRIDQGTWRSEESFFRQHTDAANALVADRAVQKLAELEAYATQRALTNGVLEFVKRVDG